MGKHVTKGFQDHRPMKEQRESLPVFRLRDQLISAVSDNQVLVVIGETGKMSPCHNPSLIEQLNLPCVLSSLQLVLIH